MYDKPIYQSAEAERWFERYVAAIGERDEAKAEVEGMATMHLRDYAEINLLRAVAVAAEQTFLRQTDYQARMAMEDIEAALKVAGYLKDTPMIIGCPPPLQHSCEHDWDGPNVVTRDDDGRENGASSSCAKCGMLYMTWALWMGDE